MLDVKTMGESEIDEMYAKLCTQIDSQSFGFAHNTSVPGISLIKRLFTPEQAAYILEIPVSEFFTALDYANMIGVTEEEAEELLHDLSMHGLCFRTVRDGQKLYRSYPMIPGLIEPNAPRIADEPGIGQDLIAAFQDGWMPKVFETGIPFLRAIPIDKNLVADGLISDDDDIDQILSKRRRFAAAKCTCRLSTRACGLPETGLRDDTCIQTDEWADYYIDNGVARDVSREEARAIIQDSIDKGACIEICNSQNSEIICCCQKDTCAILMNQQLFPIDDNLRQMSNYRVQRDPELCSDCGTCVDVCVTKSTKRLDDGSIEVADNCYGCGQCVKNCSTGARSLVQKPAGVYVPFNDRPVGVFDTYLEIEAFRRAEGDLKE